jgi:uncharacterized membrane protein
MDTDSRYGVDTFASLREQPAPPLDVDLDRAIATGRRRVRIKRAAAVSGAAALTTVAVAAGVLTGTHEERRTAPVQPPPSATVAPACRVAALPAPPGEKHLAPTGIDPSGRYAIGAVAGSEETEAPGRATLWDDGRLLDLPVPGFAPTPLGVNASGVVVGGVTRDDKLAAWVYRDGRVQTLPAYEGRPMVANAVNARGDIVGVAFGDKDLTTAVLWPAAQPGTVRALDPRAVPSAALGISDAGVVVGHLGGGPVFWDAKGFLRQPPTVYDDAGAMFGIVGDWAYGVAGGNPPSIREAPANSGRAVRWHLKAYPVPRVDALTGVMPAGITRDGDTVGISSRIEAQPPYRDAVIRGAAPMVELAHLTEARDSDEATGVSADGRVIVGRQTAGDGAETPLIWHC